MGRYTDVPVILPDEFLDSLKGKPILVSPMIIEKLESYLDHVHDMSMDVGDLHEHVMTYVSHMVHLAEEEKQTAVG